MKRRLEVSMDIQRHKRCCATPSARSRKREHVNLRWGLKATAAADVIDNLRLTQRGMIRRVQYMSTKRRERVIFAHSSCWQFLAQTKGRGSKETCKTERFIRFVVASA